MYMYTCERTDMINTSYNNTICIIAFAVTYLKNCVAE